jgi:hypothetical protein
MNRIILIIVAAVLAVVVITHTFGEPEVVEGLLSDSIGRQVAEMEAMGFDRVDSDRLDGATIVSFERDGEEMISILDKAGNVIGHWQLFEAESF